MTFEVENNIWGWKKVDSLSRFDQVSLPLHYLISVAVWRLCGYLNGLLVILICFQN